LIKIQFSKFGKRKSKTQQNCADILNELYAIVGLNVTASAMATISASILRLGWQIEGKKEDGNR
jgi:hypothetical protein